MGKGTQISAVVYLSSSEMSTKLSWSVCLVLFVSLFIYARVCVYNLEEKMPNSLAADAAPLAVHTTAGRMTAESLSVESLSPLVMDCGVYLPGCRHRGRALVVAELSLLRSHLPPVSHLAQLVAYYQTVPRKSAAKNGLILLVVGRPDQSSSAFGLIEQLLCHFHVVAPIWREDMNRLAKSELSFPFVCPVWDALTRTGTPAKVYRWCRHLERRRGCPWNPFETIWSNGKTFLSYYLFFFAIKMFLIDQCRGLSMPYLPIDYECIDDVLVFSFFFFFPFGFS